VPPALDDILGQSDAIGPLRRAYLADRLPHGMIFAGPSGVGKFTTARALGALFLCADPKKDRPCGACDGCRAFESGNHPDFHVITKELIRYHDKSGKSKGINLSIDVIRPELIAKASLKPVMRVGKVFVSEQADLMSAGAQNAMLKTLEEPAGRTLIILLTDQPDALLPTVLSRCRTVRFAALEESVVREQLVARGISSTDAKRAAAITDGSLGLALRWIDDGVIDLADALTTLLRQIESGGGASTLPGFLKHSADAYAEKQLKRDELASKDQAMREGLGILFRLASQHYRRKLGPISEDALPLERACAAIDAVARAEEYLDANVSVPLLLQQLAVTLEMLHAEAVVAAT
jgi:DNA polymerase-3 subunit delta'